MNWIFEAYSNVYNAALLHDVNRKIEAANAGNHSQKPSAFGRLFGRS